MRVRPGLHDRVLVHCNPPFRYALTDARNERDKELFMLDVVMLALGLGFFAVGIGYAYACERL
jgi:hypothetical protein